MSLFGSWVDCPGEAMDLDVHAVTPYMDAKVFSALARAAEVTARAFGNDWLVEVRHGPLRPPEGRRQIHLIVDDLQSLEQVSFAVLARREATGLLLLGETIIGRWRRCGTKQELAREACAELLRWRTALAGGGMPFRQWTFDGAAKLNEGVLQATSDREWADVLRGATRSAALHCRLAGNRNLPMGPFGTASEAIGMLDRWIEAAGSATET